MSEQHTGYGLIPYTEDIADEFLAMLFVQMQQDGTASQVFLEREITDAEKWIEFVKSPGCHLFIPFFDGVPVGVCWLDRFQEKWVQYHFCLFKNTWGHGKSVELGKWVLTKLLTMEDEHGYLLDMLVGILPTRHRLALRYVRKCGGQVGGLLPLGVFNGNTGQSEEATLITLTREDLR
ncbi:hypothetical protein SYK_06580 [Pseudodesulfovibrio nedwellii]|uniref:GNAT family N-acetyltransferase n=1 Tax=Pseudodesulfovibrio nedwellii TaxID=2973072 RepID=A0ABM8AXR5_9BACT|nr:hypothetical protein [Pseudodesulfovibrio nedwellii]BDQ36298.1 hypothetical protein SYK_06580 [Pseudodesulfovibrio nedwellii]